MKTVTGCIEKNYHQKNVHYISHTWLILPQTDIETGNLLMVINTKENEGGRM